MSGMFSVSDATITPPVEPMLSTDDLAAFLRTSRRTVERMRAAGAVPKPDLMVGKMPRWRAESIRKWSAGN